MTALCRALLLLILTCCSCLRIAAQADVAEPTVPQANVAESSTPPGQPPPGFQSRNPRYQINPGDVLELAFALTPEFNQTVQVQPDGYVSLKGVGDLHVAGHDIPQVTSEVVKIYSSVLHQPSLSITLKEFDKPHFTVGGQVNKPGKYELRSDTTMTEAVAQAGGFNQKAKHSQVLLFRRVNNDWYEVRKLDVKKIQQGEAQEDVHLRAGDMIFVPQNKISKISTFLPSWGLSTYTSPKQY